MWDPKTQAKLEAHLEKMFPKEEPKRKKPGKRKTVAKSGLKRFQTGIFSRYYHG